MFVCYDYNITRQYIRRALSGARGGEPPRAPSRVHDVGELEDERVAPVREGRPVAPLEHAAVRAVPAAADAGLAVDDEARRHAAHAQVADRPLVQPVVLEVGPAPRRRHGS